MAAGSNRQVSPQSAIQAEGVSVIYRVPRERVSGIKEYTIRRLQRRLAYEEFTALRDVSFQVRSGEVFGVIGRNGSGKSTLFKVIARVLVPRQGRMVIRGRVAPLLELGAGFQPELTGRENVFLNSALLGRTRAETEHLLPEIIDFAEIGDFLDAPLRTYSTGMIARLGFAVATCVRPDILLVDEVLSVGDAQFQQKCLDRIQYFREQGATILIVTHSMATVEAFCERALWLEGGEIGALGPAADVIEQYILMNRSPKGPPQPAPQTVEQMTAAQIAEKIQAFTPLDQVGGTYPTSGIFNLKQGGVSVWLKFNKDGPHSDAIIFHTSDSRYVLYQTPWRSADNKTEVPLLVARAGGNRRVLNPYYGTSNFPEVSLVLGEKDSQRSAALLDENWHLIIMTWEGYPEGRLHLYIDGRLAGETSYDRRHDDGRGLPNAISVGMRPSTWMGELIQTEDGTLAESRPVSTMSVSEGGLEMKDLRLYMHSLKQQEVQAVLAEGV